MTQSILNGDASSARRAEVEVVSDVLDTLDDVVVESVLVGEDVLVSDEVKSELEESEA